jgi:hypothetical protein
MREVKFELCKCQWEEVRDGEEGSGFEMRRNDNQRGE